VRVGRRNSLVIGAALFVVVVAGAAGALLADDEKQPPDLSRLRSDPVAGHIPSEARLIREDEVPPCSDSDRDAKLVRHFSSDMDAAEVVTELAPLLAGKWQPAAEPVVTSDAFVVHRFERTSDPNRTLKVVEARGSASRADPDWNIEITLQERPSSSC
jgi:hypothetical protein